MLTESWVFLIVGLVSLILALIFGVLYGKKEKQAKLVPALETKLRESSETIRAKERALKELHAKADNAWGQVTHFKSMCEEIRRDFSAFKAIHNGLPAVRFELYSSVADTLNRAIQYTDKGRADANLAGDCSARKNSLRGIKAVSELISITPINTIFSEVALTTAGKEYLSQSGNSFLLYFPMLVDSLKVTLATQKVAS